jgi:hypothetical protein
MTRAREFATGRGELLDLATADKRLSSLDVRVLTRLLHVYANRQSFEIWVAPARIANEVHKSLRQVRRSYRQLVEVGYLTLMRRSRGGQSKNGKPLTSRYRMGAAATVTPMTLLAGASTVTGDAADDDKACASTVTPTSHKPLDRTLRENPSARSPLTRCAARRDGSAPRARSAGDMDGASEGATKVDNVTDRQLALKELDARGDRDAAAKIIKAHPRAPGAEVEALTRELADAWRERRRRNAKGAP